MIEKRIGKQVKTFKTDNGLEFYNALFDEYCKKEGIVRHTLLDAHYNRMRLSNI